MDQPAWGNATLIPAAMDLLLAVPRLAQRAGQFALFHMPEAVDNIAGKIFNGGSIIADPTARQTVNSTITNTSQAFLRQSTDTAGFEAAIKDAFASGNTTRSSVLIVVWQWFTRLKSMNFGGVFSYLTSRWALATFTAAIVLNRTQFYASSREHLQLRWFMRLALYALPIASFLTQLLFILQALKCQTSPDFALLRYGDPLKQLSIDFGGEGGFLYKLSSTLLFWEDDMSCCAARQMSLIAVDSDRTQLRGSMSLLFTFFLTLCTSQLFETLACALQGRLPMPETGMTIFEHSLAFAECEAMISSALGFGFFGGPKLSSSTSSGSGENTGPLMSRAEIMQRLNVPPEMLLICLISCFSHLASATLAVTGLRQRVRLLNTALWACCYMAAFMWSFTKIFLNPIESITELGMLRFPTVCIVGFIPHVLILIGIFICAVIYGLALLITALSVPREVSAGLSFRQRLAWAYGNLQANVQFSSSSSIRIKMSEDFYTTLLKVGFTLLTAASEAVYLNEGSRIHVAQMTWLEQKRIDELADGIEQRKTPAVPAELLGEGIARGVDFSDHHNVAFGRSPYARERKSRPTKSDHDRPGAANDLDSGLGIAQRRSRMQLTFDFIAGLFWLIIGLQANLVLNTLRRLGVERRPSWLLKAAGVMQKQKGTETHRLGDDTFPVPTDSNVDIELETRQRLASGENIVSEESLGDILYSYWRNGGWFGDLDASGEYSAPSVDDDDATSVISMSTDGDMMDDEHSDTADAGRRTPTQHDPLGERSGQSTPVSEAELDLSMLSRLLNPQSASEREEARLLSYSLQTHRPMTRSQYRRNAERTRALLLSGLRGRNPNDTASAEEEEHDLETFILERRSNASAAKSGGGTWETGAEGMGASGPQCVVCQSTPRTILVWPCGCLSMCDECRVGLAARNYTKCICCRTDIAAYSRLYVP
ncbi:hypothetical protein BDY17DRAFT_290300 [Neohortaea acidophila]|uniref:Ubiquitin-protein ligase-like protein n=1 Tax=Neohortaea acidophila TaxID=245834 RepID=A0A6A6Q7U6_9PEZI|nr:uncharacterized protein BDY17DRAFT_290300 [Neohortaea acidophila]KAF2488141.1 hypothetical protein BDY17DRAFT_290300 [Neohortaea acidophila]